MPTQTPRPAFDLELLNENWSGMEPLYRRILGLFHGETVKRVSELREALARDDRPEVQRLSHAIKGSAGNVCALSLHGSAAALEREALGAPLPALRACFERLEEDWRLLDAAIGQGGPRHGG